VTSHYSGPTDTPAWTTNTASEWRRNIPGINGTLVAIQNNGETPVLQLHNLHDDIIATAYKSETATELATKADTSEYGVPGPSAPAKYSWLGAIQLPTELPSGIISMGARSYVPQLGGRYLQPDPIPGGSANAYSYTFGDPVNSNDPTGTTTILQLIAGHAAQVGAEELAKEEAERRAAEEAAARATAAKATEEAAWAGLTAGGPQYLGEEEEWEEWEEWEEGESEYEYTSYHKGAEGRPAANEEVHVEPGVLYQPLGGEGAGEGASLLGAVVPLCRAGSGESCADFEVWSEHVPRRVFRISCKVVAALAIGCGVDDFLQRQREYELQHPPQVTVESSGGGSDEEDIWRMASEDGSFEDE
jgi:RHS repeat-associated protein